MKLLANLCNMCRSSTNVLNAYNKLTRRAKLAEDVCDALHQYIWAVENSDDVNQIVVEKHKVQEVIKTRDCWMENNHDKRN